METSSRVGVRRVYGVVGVSLNPVIDAVRRHDFLEWIQVRHEEVAAFAAGAEAQKATWFVGHCAAWPAAGTESAVRIWHRHSMGKAGRHPRSFHQARRPDGPRLIDTFAGRRGKKCCGPSVPHGPKSGNMSGGWPAGKRPIRAGQ